MKREMRVEKCVALLFSSLIPHPSSFDSNRAVRGPVPPATTPSYWGEDSFTYDPDQTDPQISLSGSSYFRSCLNSSPLLSKQQVDRPRRRLDGHHDQTKR
jgi:hypothetical protein